MSVEIKIPLLAGSRERARQLFDGIPDNLDGVPVILNGNNAVASAASFADELVVELLLRRNALELRPIGCATADVMGFLRERAAHHGVSDRVQESDG